MDQERAVGQQCLDLLWDSFEATTLACGGRCESTDLWLVLAAHQQDDGARSGCFSRLQTDWNGSQGEGERLEASFAGCSPWVLCHPGAHDRASKP